MPTLSCFLPTSRRLLQYAFPPVLAGVLAGCAVAPQTAVPHTAAVSQPSAVVNPSPGGATALPKVDLSPELLFRLVVAEIAAQRGQPGTAYTEYLRVARATKDPRMAKRAMEIALSARALQEALDAADIWYQIAPLDPESGQAYISLLLASGQYDLAQPLLDIQLAHAPNPSELLDRIQRAVVGAPEPAHSYMFLQALAAPYLSRADQGYDIQLILARAAQAAGDSNRALWHVREARRLRPEAEPALIALAQLLLEPDRAGPGAPPGRTADQLLADRNEVITTLQKFLRDHPNANAVQLIYARALVGAGRYADAQAQFEDVLRRAPDNAEPLFALGVLELESEHFDEARGHFDRYLAALTPESGRDFDVVYLNLARACQGQHQYADALNWMRKVNSSALAGQRLELEAFALVHLDRVDEALGLLRDLPSETAQQREQRIVLLGQVLREAHRDAESFALLDQALSASPDDPALLYETAMSAERLDRLDVMETHIRRLVALHPDYAHAYNALGYSLADRNVRLNEAYDLVKKALNLSPDDAFIIDSMGWVQFRLGKLDESRALLERAFRIKADTDVAAHLGEVLWAQGDHDAARAVLLNAQRHDRDSEALRGALKRLNIQP